MLGSSELLVVLAVILVLFGGSHIPKLARNLGRAQSEFRRGLDDARVDDPTSNETTAPSRTADD